jgi:hypothetical protein
MSIMLNDEQRQAVATSGDKPVEVIDEQNRRYVLLPADVFERMTRQLKNEVIDPSFFEAGEFAPDSDELPAWCNVLEGMSDKDREYFRATLSTPIGLANADPKSGLPVIECKHAASPAEELTPERAANILLAQEVTWQREAGR